ncbi:pilin [Microbispora triticiradicis]|uniref:pilin n=1 Tax=Microbispora triticiradicis TaxID=2200763 RepID=UPI0026C0DB89|nr:pilin [Microbispora triticiradicis]
MASHRTGRQTVRAVAAVATGMALGLVIETGIAWAISDTGTVSGVLAAPSSLNQVIDNLRNVIVGLLVALATLFLTIGGVRYILAGGDPSEVEAAKKTLRYAGIGYGIATLAPLLVSILKGIVGA